MIKEKGNDRADYSQSFLGFFWLIMRPIIARIRAIVPIKR